MSLFFLVTLFLPHTGWTQGQKSDVSLIARKTISLLDYVSQDYGKAISKGRILNWDEYTEMLDFTGNTENLFDTLASKVKMQNAPVIAAQLKQLANFIKQKQDKEIVEKQAQNVKKQIILLNLIELSPASWPSLSEGKRIFAANCQSCHGTTGAGNGPLSASFTPRPANFLNDTLMQAVSPLQVFNTVRLGIQGTGMRAFDELSDKEIWQIAFYVKSLRFQRQAEGDKEKSDSLGKSVSLNDVARLSDKELLDKYHWQKNDPSVATLRLHNAEQGRPNTLNISLDYLEDALSFYKSGNFSLASDKALDAYLEGVEPVEQQLMATDATIVPELEKRMNALRTALKAHRSQAEVKALVEQAKESVNKAAVLMGNQTYSFWFTFLMALSILLREGLEAVLIIVTILSVLKSLKAKQAQKWVHYGWLTALFIGTTSWFFTDLLLSMGAAYREVMEGFGAFFAVIVLLYVGFWLHSKTQASKWKAFVETKITRLLDQKKMFGLALISFLVVFREAFESVIFLSSLHLQVDAGSKNGIWMGAIAALAVVLFLSQMLLKYSIKLPIRKLFQYSSVVIQILAVVLAGQAVHAFQESGWIAVQSFPINFRIAVLGIYPTWETYGAQLFALLIVVFIWRKQNKKMLEKIQTAKYSIEAKKIEGLKMQAQDSN